MEQLKKAGYAVIGIGDLAVEKTTEIIGKARTNPKAVTKDVGKAFEGLAKRGKTRITGIYRSKPVKRAKEQTKNATRQIKGAATSLRKAAGAEEQKAS